MPFHDVDVRLFFKLFTFSFLWELVGQQNGEVFGEDTL